MKKEKVLEGVKQQAIGNKIKGFFFPLSKLLFISHIRFINTSIISLNHNPTLMQPRFKFGSVEFEVIVHRSTENLSMLVD